MSRPFASREVAILLVIMANVSFVTSVGVADPEDNANLQQGIYHSDPKHLWNRLHSVFWDRVGPDGRVYGHDRVDPLLWKGTRHLLDGPSRTNAFDVLKEFLETHGENLIDDPLKRAVLQRDLWAIFDWLVDSHEKQITEVADEAKRLLGPPLAQAIGRLALDPVTIEKLPDTYAAAVASQQFPTNFDPSQPQISPLPQDLFDPDGPWVCVGRNGSDIIAPVHATAFSRSIFQVFMKRPEGRKAASEYLTALSQFKEPFVPERSSPESRVVYKPNPELPQFPADTQLVIVRCALLIDSESRLHATRLVESVQLRGSGNYELTLRRARLFGGISGGLRPISSDERDFHTGIAVKPIDAFEHGATSNAFGGHRPQLVLRSCVSCHRGPGVFSFNTLVGGFYHDLFTREFNHLLDDAKTTDRGEKVAIRLKQARNDWKQLDGLLSRDH